MAVPAFAGENPWDADKPDKDTEIPYPEIPEVIVVGTPSTTSVGGDGNTQLSWMSSDWYHGLWMSATYYVVSMIIVEESAGLPVRADR